MRKRKMYLSVEDIAELFELSVSFGYRVVERMNADLASKNYYVILGQVYGAAEPPVRCGESHLSGLTEPPHFVY